MLYRIYVNSNSQHETKSFTKAQWDIMFERRENIKRNENESEHCLFASKDITISCLDNTMNLLILGVVCPLFKSVNVVSECQSQITKIAVQQRKVTGREFSDIWDKLEAHIDKISSHFQLSTCFMDKCSIMKEAIFNRSQTRMNRQSILEDALNNHNFIKDTQFCNRARKELAVIMLETNVNHTNAYCGKNIPVQLVDGKYIKGAYSHSVMEQAEKDLQIVISVSTNQGSGEKEENEGLKDLKEKVYNHNHLKIVQLITGIATHALVNVLKSKLPSANFGFFFNGMKSRLALLLDEREYQLLYPDNSKYNGDLSDLDISLLYIILRNLNTIPPPHENRWGKKPKDDDRCLSANIDRIRIFKNNFVSHCSKLSLNEEEFLKTWKAIAQCIIELGGEEYNQKIDVLFTSAIDPLMESELVCNAREKLEESKRDERKVTILKERNDNIKLNLNIINRQQIDNVQEKISDDPPYKATQRASNRTTQVDDPPSLPMDTTLLYCRSDSDSANTTTEETTANANTTNLPSGDNMQPGNIPLVLSLHGRNLSTVVECKKRIQNVRIPEVQITFVKDGSIIIGLDVAPQAFHNVGNFIAIIDTLVSILLQGKIQNKNEHSSYVVVSLDFLDRNNEPLTLFQPSLLEDKGGCLEKDKATDVKEELKENCVDVSYKKEHIFTTEDVNEQYKNIITKLKLQHKPVYVPRSSKEIQSKVLQIKGQAKGTTFYLDKSSVTFRPENPMKSTLTNISDKTAEQDAIYKMNLGIDTTTVSLALYRYLCANIVGTENYVKTIRLMNNVKENMISSKHLVPFVSGSFGEGLLMRGSDLDVMIVSKSIEVNADEKNRLDPFIASCKMVTDDVKPGFTQLLAENYDCTLSECYVRLNGKHYLSSTLFKRYLLGNQYTLTIHGPISDKSGLIGDVVCLHCKTWISQAAQWISRSSNSWPSYGIKRRIIKNGVLFLPIGVKGSLKEDIEWRISFSVGEQILISTFTHTQLLCYALLKIVLKDVIAIHAECEDLLCSYYLKTIIFWISEELPQSVWNPDNLIPCFMRCLSRLIYCVEYSACLHYFIPENNMFENRIEGSARIILLDKLYTLRRYGWRCVLFSDQLSNLHEFMLIDHTETHTLHTFEVEKTLFSKHLHWPNYMDFNMEICAYKSNCHKLLFCDNSAIKYFYEYNMSRWCAQYAQSISLTNTSSNKLQYKQYTSCLCTLLQSIHHDAVSGWLMLASFFYKSKQYHIALHILTCSLSKCTSEKLYSFMEMSDMHYQLLRLKSFQKKTLVRFRKIFLVDDIKFHKDSWLIPDELQMEENSETHIFVSSIVYGYFLTFLCHYHLNNVRQCQDSIQKLQRIKEKDFFNKTIQFQAYNILRIASRIFGNPDTARQEVKKEEKKNLDPEMNTYIMKLSSVSS